MQATTMTAATTDTGSQFPDFSSTGNFSTVLTTEADQNSSTFSSTANQFSTNSSPSFVPSSPNIGAIVGGGIGGLVAIGLIILFIVLWRKRTSRDTTKSETPAEPEHRISMPSNPTTTPSNLPDANSDYDSVLPTASRGSYYKDYRYNGSNLHPAGHTDDENDSNPVYVNDPTNPYVNFASKPPKSTVQETYYDDDQEEHFYGNLPHPSRSPSARRHIEDEEDEYLPMNSFRK